MKWGLKKDLRKDYRRQWTTALCKTDTYTHPQNLRRSKVGTVLSNMKGGEALMSLCMSGHKCCCNWFVPYAAILGKSVSSFLEPRF